MGDNTIDTLVGTSSQRESDPLVSTNKGEYRFSQLYADLSPKLQRVLMGKLRGQPELAQDLVQDTFTRAYSRLHQFTPGTNFKAWVTRMGINLLINYVRREKKAPELYDNPDDVVFKEGASARMYELSPEEGAMYALGKERVHAFIESIPSENFRAAVVLCDLQGMSYKEIARKTNTPMGTVMSRIFRGRSSLRERAREFVFDPETGEPTTASGYVPSKLLEEEM